MRLVALCALVVLAGCQTPAERQAAHAESALKACDIQQLASHEYQAIKDNLPPPGGSPSLALQTLPKRATPVEARIVQAFYTNYFLPCRKFRLEALALYGREVVAIAADSYRAQDSHWLALGNRDITWGRFNRTTAATTAESITRIQAAIGRHQILEAARPDPD